MKTEEIWNRLSAELKRFILRRVPDEAVADDILQDVFIKIHGALDTVRESDRLDGWIYRIARHAIADHYRARIPTDELPPTLAQSDPEPAERSRQEGAQCLRPLIEDLPERYRQAILLSEIEGLPHREIAARLGLSVSGVKSRVQRGRALLKDMILSSCRLEFDARGIPTDCDRDASACDDRCPGEDPA